jgi:short-subunit dehydrogenase
MPSNPRLLHILITGATAGIGRDAAFRLAKLGHRVFATGRRRDVLDAMTREAAGTTLETLVLDVTDAESIAAAVVEVDRRTDGHGIDVLVNNAGYGQLGPVDAIPDELLRANFETNVFGLVAVTRAFLPAMRTRGNGRIINLSSLAGRVSQPFMGAYCATKFAVEAMSDAMRNELAPFGIDVVIVEPGYIRTQFADTSMATLQASMKGSVYARQLAKADAVLARFEATASEPGVVTDAIVAAATARRPRTRYFAPWWAGFATIANWLPTRLSDWAIRKVLGMELAADEIPRVAATA